MSGPRTAPIASRPAVARTRTAPRRRSQRDSQALTVACLTMLATAVSLYDLIALAVGLS